MVLNETRWMLFLGKGNTLKLLREYPDDGLKTVRSSKSKMPQLISVISRSRYAQMLQKALSKQTLNAIQTLSRIESLSGSLILQENTP